MPYKRIYCSISTNKIIQEKIAEAVKTNAKRYGIEQALVKAIIKQESGGYQYAIRYEPGLTKAEWYKKTLPKKHKTNSLAYCSMGTMQVLYGIARHEGFKGEPEDLLAIDTSVKHGCIHLSNVIKRYYWWADVVSSYNQGRPGRYKSGKNKGKFWNQEYVDSVYKFYRQYGGKINMKEDEKKRGK